MKSIDEHSIKYRAVDNQRSLSMRPMSDAMVMAISISMAKCFLAIATLQKTMQNGNIMSTPASDRADSHFGFSFHRHEMKK